MTKFLKKSLAAVGASGLAAQSFAAGVDFTPLTSGIDFASTSTAIMAVAVALIGLAIVVKGAKLVLRFVRG